MSILMMIMKYFRYGLEVYRIEIENQGDLII